jgi:hypothetical protein
VIALTEVSLVGGASLRAAGEPSRVEAQILSAARGSLMELAWLTDAATGMQVGVNPDHVVMLRPVDDHGLEGRPAE